MAYATASETSQHGAAVYGAGNFEIRRAEGGYIYFPTPAKAAAIRATGSGAAAMDSADETNGVGSAAWFAHASEAEIAALVKKRRCKQVAADKGVDRETERIVRRLLPKALAIIKAEDAAEAEAEIEGDKNGENHDLFNTGPEAEDENGSEIGSAWRRSLEKAKTFWQRVATRNRQGSQLPGRTGHYSSSDATASKRAIAADSKSGPVKVDVVSRNARNAKQHSLFARF